MLVLAQEGRIQDGTLCADLMRAWIDERRVFKVLINETLDRIQRQQRRLQPQAAPCRKGRMLQERTDHRRLVVQNTVRPERVVIDVARLQQADHRFEKGFVFHAPRDLIQIEPMDIGLVEKRVYLLRRAVLREPRPRLGVGAAQPLHDVECEWLGRADHAPFFRKGHRIVRETPGRREGKAPRSGWHKAQHQINAFRREPGIHGNQPTGICSKAFFGARRWDSSAPHACLDHLR